ncbi:MAG: Gfo/Idh/MocA family oxidoreductase [Gammaproteobacteria bacterium]|nr:Gfo/Idh/MocA family oxidoreductase [Gammaproteobacteria bacterium]
MADLRWGMIGSSGWADHTFAPAVARARGNKLVAVLGSTASGAQGFAERHGIARAHAHTELKALLADAAVDAVWVASPPDLHRVQAVAALQAGKHVLCEKPMAVSVADCRAMTRAAQAAGRLLHVGFNNRSHPQLQALAKAIAQGRYGEALEARVQVYHPYPSPPPQWRQNRRRSGGWAIGDVGTHLLDVLRWLMNADAAHAQGVLSSRCWGFKTDDHAAVNVVFKNGAVGNITACTGAAGGAPRVEFYGTKGYFILRGGLFGMPGELESGLKGRESTTVAVAGFDTYGGEVELFAKAVRGKAVSLASGDDGVANIRLVAAARGW